MGWSAAPSVVEPMVQQQQQQQVLPKQSFDPKKHLKYTRPSKIHTMEELGFAEKHGVSPIAVSEPFPLFNEEAVMRFREEVLSKEVIDNCSVSSNLSHGQLRGFVSKQVACPSDECDEYDFREKLTSHDAGMLLLCTTHGRTQRCCASSLILQGSN